MSKAGAWSTTLTTQIFVYVLASVIALGIAVYVLLLATGDLVPGGISLALLLVVAIAVACFIRLRVTIDGSGLRVVSALLPITLKHVPLGRIRLAEVAELHPMEWGGWGYRIFPGRSAIILRSGPGLVVTTTNDKQFAISLPDPQPAAAVTNALLSQQTNE